MKVYVLVRQNWDDYTTEILSVHKTKEGAEKELNRKKEDYGLDGMIIKKLSVKG